MVMPDAVAAWRAVVLAGSAASGVKIGDRLPGVAHGYMLNR